MVFSHYVIVVKSFLTIFFKDNIRWKFFSRCYDHHHHKTQLVPLRKWIFISNIPIFVNFWRWIGIILQRFIHDILYPVIHNYNAENPQFSTYVYIYIVSVLFLQIITYIKFVYFVIFDAEVRMISYVLSWTKVDRDNAKLHYFEYWKWRLNNIQHPS